mmetsp:Transcript_15044/g.30986  ORF Transcript_15044/g.30986 Transcript_15044/m.30986 type:complete len:916 (-) Transcript_15044:15-2762(-)
MISARTSTLACRGFVLRGASRCLSSSSAKIPDSVDAVVIGGGSLGASCAYHLQKSGLKTVLLERDDLTSGTTWHSAGMLWRLRPSDIDIELHTYTRDMCLRLEEETEEKSFTENGGLFIANNKERFDEYQRLHETGKFFGIESSVLTDAASIKEIHPLMNTDDVYGALYSPTDGTIDPTSVVNAYAKAAKKLGASIHTKTAVSSISTVPSLYSSGATRVTSVTTESGHTISTPIVINACGAWAGKISEMVDAPIPLLAMKHAMVVTEKIEGMNPSLPNVRDHDLSIYFKTQGDAMCIGGYERNPEFWDSPSDTFSFGLFELDWDTFNQNLEGHLQRCPSVEQVGIKSTVCGPESFTPDHKPLVGPQPGVHGFFQCCGFNSMGMMLGGGIGREVANWVNFGSPSVDLFSFDVSRFHQDTVKDAKWVKDRTHESYAKTYAIVFPHDEALAGRGARQSGFFEELSKRGCIYQARHGMERPGWFDLEGNKDMTPLDYDYYGAYEDGGWRLGEGRSDVPANAEHPYLDAVEGELTFGIGESFDAVGRECKAAREGVAMFDQSYFGNFHLKGKGASAFVDYLCGAEIVDKAVGSVTYTTLCNGIGGVEADLTVAKLGEEDYYFSAGGQTVTKDLWWVKMVMEEGKWEDVELVDVGDDTSILSVQGPHSRALLERLVAKEGSLDRETFDFSTCKELELTTGHSVLFLRLTFVGELGFELHVAKEDAADVYRELWKLGEAYSQENDVAVVNAGYRAIDSLSAEKNFRHWHADLSNRDTPMEAGVGFTVLPKLKKEKNFLGAEALQAKRKEGLKRKLVCLTVPRREDGSPVALHGMETIWRNGECVGVIRSTAFGYSIDQTVAYGYVEAEKLGWNKITNKTLGEEALWEIGGVGGTRYKSNLSLKAPFDPKSERVDPKSELLVA